MKVLRVLLLATLISQTAAPGISVAEPVAWTERDRSLAEDAALALNFRARMVVEKVQSLALTGPTSQLSRAERLARQIQLNALAIAQLLVAGSDESEVLAILARTETLVLQLDNLKRDLQRIYRNDRELVVTFNLVRQTYFFLKQELLGGI